VEVEVEVVVEVVIKTKVKSKVKTNPYTFETFWLMPRISTLLPM
jgi:hypothetical protein